MLRWCNRGLTVAVVAWDVQMLPSEFLNLDAVMERAMVKCIVKPLKEHVYRLFTYDLTRYYAIESDLNFT